MIDVLRAYTEGFMVVVPELQEYSRRVAPEFRGVPELYGALFGFLVGSTVELVREKTVGKVWRACDEVSKHMTMKEQSRIEEARPRFEDYLFN